MDQPVDWRRLREFADVDLEKSFVLSWQYEVGTLMVDVDLFLMPSHPFYEKPRPKEKVCIRPAIIEFPYCESLTLNDGSDAQIPADVAGRLGQGAITQLRVLADGRYEIVGDFGSVHIEAERPILKLRSP